MNKEKLIAWLEQQQEQYYKRGSQYDDHWYAIDGVIKQVKTGTFDDEVTP